MGMSDQYRLDGEGLEVTVFFSLFHAFFFISDDFYYLIISLSVLIILSLH